MFGSLRFVLALLVVATHMKMPIWLGVYAVFGFYLISGYLMCLVLNQRYGFGALGLRAYFTNRFLRIYPPYWFACLVTVALIGVFGEPAAARFWPPWSLPPTAMDWIDNAGIVTLPTGWENRLVPPAWALRVEVFYYAAIGLGLGRGRGIAIAWALASAGYHAHLVLSGGPWEQRYFPIAAASLPFSLGALVYHFRDALPRHWHASNAWLLALLLVWAGNLLPGLADPLGPARFYLNLACVAALVALLCRRTAGSSGWRRRDARLGDLAYPIYLLHMQVGFALANLGFLPPHPTRLLGLAALVPLVASAWVMLKLVDDPVERLRTRVKRAFAERADATPTSGAGAV